MKKHSTLLVLAITAFSWTSPQAHAWTVPNDGFLIQLSTPNGIPQKSGQTAEITGSVTWVGGHLATGQLGWGGAGYNSNTLNQLIQQDGLQVNAYFPDATTDVTSQVQLSYSRDGINVQYTTPTLQTQVPSAFTLIVSHQDPIVLADQQIEAKLNVRIAAFQAAIASLTGQRDSAQDIAWLQAIVTDLQSISARINQQIMNGNEVLAEEVFPLQVDNIVASASMNSSLIEPFRFTVSYALGSAIEGESTTATGAIYRDPADTSVGLGNGKWIPRFFWNNNQVQQLAAQSIAPGAQVQYSYPIDDLNPQALNTFSESLSNNGFDDGGFWNWFSWWEQPNFFSQQGGGALAYALPVAEDNTSPAWQAGGTPSQNVCMNAMQPIDVTAFDSLGLVDPTSVEAGLTGTQTTGATVNEDITSQITATSPDQGQTYEFTGNLNPIPDGLYNFSIASADLAGNATTPNPYTAQFRVDSVPPTVTLGSLAQIYTNAPYTNVANLAFSATTMDYFDLCSITTTATDNGSPIATSTTGSLNVSQHLTDGVHEIQVSAVNSSDGLTSTIQSFPLIVDTVPPVLSNVSPSPNSTINTLAFTVSGQANEPLLSAAVNGQSLALSSNGMSFSGQYTAQTSGLMTLQLTATDLATNVTTQTFPVQIQLSVLNQSLISIVPGTNGTTVDVIGAAGATLPGQTVTLSSGLFSSESVVANANGSFEIVAPVFTSASITVNDTSIGMSNTDTLTYGSPSGGTLLSGTVEDNTGSPLVGATIAIANNSTVQPVTTNTSGVFTFKQPATGTQTLIINGTTVPTTSQNGVSRTFSTVSVQVNIGIDQSNVLQTPIYLNPIYLDGSATLVSASSGSDTTVTDVHAPNVSLTIPGGSPSFPNTSAQSNVSIETVASTYSTIPVPKFAVPTNVVALEPSGTTFSSPVSVTFPNSYNLPAGTQEVIMSMNSLTGSWGLDGVAQVSSDGQSVSTLPGEGITHFSVIYPVPLMPGAIALKGQDNSASMNQAFSGSLNKTISLPSYRVLGQTVTPKLIYNSSWAKPEAMLSNVFDLSAETVSVSQNVDGYTVYTSCESEAWGLVNNCNSQTEYWDDSVQEQAAYQPTQITAQFSYGDFTSPVLNFNAGNGNLMPAISTVSYLMKLNDPTTGALPRSGIYPYTAHYQLSLDQITTTTQTVTGWGATGSAPSVLQESSASNTQIAGVFPQDLSGTLTVDNETQSSVGAGWKIGGVQKIANPNANRVVIEEGDGSYSTFVINNTINTLLSAPSGTGCVVSCTVTLGCTEQCSTAVSFTSSTDDSWPDVIFPVVNTDNGQSDAEIEEYQLTPPASGTYNTFLSYYGSSTNPGGLVALPSGQIYETDRNGNAVLSVTSTSSSAVVGNVGQGFNGDGPISSGIQLNSPGQIIMGPSAGTLVFADTGNNRVRLIDLSQGTISTIAGNGQNLAVDTGDGGPATQASLNQPQGLAYDSVGNLYITTADNVIRKVDTTGTITTFAGNPGGYIADSIPANEARFSGPTGLIVDNQNGYVYVSDTGADRVVRIDFATMTATVVAGNGTAGNSYTGEAALAGGLNGPTWLGLDPNMNLLIADSGNSEIKQVVFGSSTAGELIFASTSSPLQGALQNSDGSWVPFLQRNLNGSWTRNYRNGTVVTFNSTGQEVSQVDRVGNETSYSYDGNGDLLSVTDPTGRNLSFSYSGGLLTTVTDPDGRSTQLGYGTNNTLTAIQYPDGTGESFTYDPTNLMLTDTNQRGNTTGYTYNQYDRVQSVIAPNGSNVAVSDTASLTALNNDTGDQTGVALAYGTTLGSAQDTVTDANGNTTSIAPDNNGFLETITDPLGNVTQIQNDPYGNPLVVTYPDNSQETTAYDSWYDAVSQTNSVTGVTTSQTFDNYGDLLSSTSGNDSTTNFVYSSTGLLTSRTDPLENKTSYTYNSHGQVLTATDPLGYVTQYTYDSAGDTTSIIDPMLHTTTMTYDGAGNRVTRTDANGNTTTYTYDAYNRVLSVTTPLSEKTQYVYSPTGHLAQITDPLGGVTTFQYDAVDNLITKTDPLGYSLTRQYDGNGNVIQETDPNGNVRSYSYDALSRILEESLPDNTINLAYDTRGRMVQANNLQATLSFSYDSSGRMLQASSSGLNALASMPSSSLSFIFDNDGNRLSMTGPTGTTRYDYDLDDRLTSLTSPYGKTYGFGFDAASRITSISRPGSSTQIVFNPANFVFSILHSSKGGTLGGYSYQRDGVENITGIQTANGINRSLAYDGTNQLLNATNPEAPETSMQAETFGYDAINNRTQDQNGSYTYGAHSQRLVQDYRYTYIYDNNGNLTTRVEIGTGIGTDGFLGETTNFFYSSQNQLIAIKVYPQGSSSPSKEITYAYDALGRRIQKNVVNNTTASSSTYNFIYDGQDILAQYDGNSNLLAGYTQSTITADDILAAHITSDGANAGLAQGAGSYMYLKDQLGTITDVADTNGNEIQHYIYSAFGELLGIQNAQAADVTSNPPLNTAYGFAGREIDAESGLMYYHARYYDPGSGRFLQKDPKPGKLQLTSSVINSYTYVANAPFRHRDPSGQSFLGDIFGGISSLIGNIGATIAGAATGNVSIGNLIGTTLLLGGIGLAVTALLPAEVIAGAIGGAVVGAIGAIYNHLGPLGTLVSIGFGGLSGFISAAIAEAAVPFIQKFIATGLIAAVLDPIDLLPGAFDDGSDSDDYWDLFIDPDQGLYNPSCDPWNWENDDGDGDSTTGIIEDGY